MSQFDIAFETVCSLVKYFKEREKHYLSHDYQEAEVRKDFIDKFFIALGWDVNHDNQHDPYQQEVKIEKTQKNQKRPDYTFFLNPNFKDPEFFAEAKKPFNDLHNADYYFQTIRYGWNANTSIAILTDFAEFHILDCRFKPDINAVLSGCHKRYHYSEYTNKETFSEIYYLFSREAIADNSIERYVANLSKPSGKAIQKVYLRGGYQTIDDDFLVYIDEVRKTLAKAFKKNDENLNSEELTEATQRTIDRLIFIRFLEDKLIEQENYVSEFGNSGNAWADFISTCKKLNVKYNGIVFKKHFIDEQNFKGPELTVFRDICDEICHLNSPYDFNAIPIHIIGSIYERFLGKVVRATDKQVKVEEKPEVRKAGGVYYTPKYIVNYIVQNTVGKLIEGKTPEQIAKLRFADIACGSGSFLIGVLDCLLVYHNRYYQNHPDKAKKDGCHYLNGKWVLSIRQKQKIMLNNIYGVDIDNQAVEVTQLSLSLKMLEDETTATANEMQVLFHEKILPDMTKNIICGNSLIGTDILSDNLFAGSEERKLNPMDFESAFPEVFKRKTEKGYNFIPDIGIDEEQDIDTSQANEPMIPYKRKIRGGFDAIIGNPPYVLIEGEFRDNRMLTYFKRKYKSASYKIDLYHLFFERGLNLLKINGKLGFITPSNFLSNNGLVGLRETILFKSYIEILNAITGKVFSGASVDTTISIFSNSNNKQKSLFIHSNWINNNLKEISQKEFDQDNFKINEGKIFISTSIKTNLNVKTFELGENYFVNFGMQLRDRKIFESDVIKTNKTTLITQYHRPCYTGKDVNKWIMGYSDLLAYFNRDAQSGGCWDESIHNSNPKIIVRQIGTFPICAIDEKGYCCLNTVFMIVSKATTEINLKFILGILNSKFMVDFWTHNYSDLRQTFPKIKGTYLKKLPIPSIDFKDKEQKERHDKIVQLVEQMLQAKKQLQTAKTDKDKSYFERRCTDLDMQIDNLVYELYGLTKEEIEIVEGK